MYYQTAPYGTYACAAPDDDQVGGVFSELCVSLWIVALWFGARTTPFPANLPLWLWLAGMPLCIPAAAFLSAKRDPMTTTCREMLYFLKRGCVLMRVVFWPFTLLAARFGDSQRNTHISDVIMRLRREHYLMKPDTALEFANGEARDTDRTFDTVERFTAQTLDTAAELPLVAARTGAFAATLAGVASAQTPPQQTPSPDPVTSILLLRTGENLQTPHTGTYRLIEFFQVRGKWIYPDLGCVDFASGTYRECFAGFDRIFVDTKRVTVTGAFYFVQATGPASHGARYLWVNPILDVRLTKKLASQTSYFPYLPLNEPARIQHVLERTKLEYSFGKHLKAGGGYGGYRFGSGPWQSKPFVTTTVLTGAGSFEFWLQKMPQGAQVQVRYKFAHTSR